MAVLENLSSGSEDSGVETDWSDLVESMAGFDAGMEEPSISDDRDEGTADCWVPRNPSLIRLTGRHPFNSEPPLSRLMHHGFITPTSLHYVRNHGHVPRTTWQEWTLDVSGLVKNPKRFTMDELISDFPTRQFPVTLVCAGNRRKEQNMVKQTLGFNWGPSAISTSLWRGVPLPCILKRCGIRHRQRNEDAMYVCFEGEEVLPGGGGGGSKYGTSIRKEYAMDPSRDILVAYMQNGEVLTPDHGFPVRIIIPGFIGGRMVKWLKRIIVTSHESLNYYHYNDNRVLPPHVQDAQLANTEAWWYKPEYIINELNINSAITTPSHDEILLSVVDKLTTSYTFRGYAYSGGGRKVTRVELTMDGGNTWRVCDVERREKPNSVDVLVKDVLCSKDIAVRAWDETLNTQPENLTWNLMGMMNNCWYRVKTHACETGIRFVHPIQLGNHTGGWMEKSREEPDNEEESSEFTAAVYSSDDLSKHKTAESAWIVIRSGVYDCTRFVKDHPGGAQSILINAGTDCTEDFEAIHSDYAKRLLKDFRIGDFKITKESPDATNKYFRRFITNRYTIWFVAFFISIPILCICIQVFIKVS